MSLKTNSDPKFAKKWTKNCPKFNEKIDPKNDPKLKNMTQNTTQHNTKIQRTKNWMVKFKLTKYSIKIDPKFKQEKNWLKIQQKKKIDPKLKKKWLKIQQKKWPKIHQENRLK